MIYKKNIYFYVLLSSFLFSQDPPVLFEFNQSTLQAFYIFEEALDINGELLESDDFVAAFNGDICVGSRQWDTSACGGGLCDVPAMGNDGADYTVGYMATGDIPTFKIYDASEDIYYDAEIDADYSLCHVPEDCSWSNNSFNMLSFVQAHIVEDSIPELFEFNQSTLQAFYIFEEAFDINGNLLEENDWVAAFKGDLCVGARKWDTSVCGGGICDVPVMGDDGSDYANGYMITGDIPTFKIYDESEGIYYDAILSNNYPWANFDFNMIDYVQAGEYVELSIPLHYENNLISFYTLPDNAEVSNVVSNITDDLVGIIGESFSAQNNNGVWQGSLMEFDTYSGYWLRMSNESDILTVVGPPPDPNKIYELHSGLNLISFPTNGSVSIPNGIDDTIEDEIPFVIGESRAAAQLDGEWVGSLMDFEGGKGYWINSNIDIDFQYDLENSSLSKQIRELTVNEFPFHQSQSQAFYFMDIGELESVAKGDWIIAYNDNVIVGSRQWNGGIIDIPVMGYDTYDNTMGYCGQNDIPSFKVYSEKTHQFIDIQSNEITKFSPNSITHIQNIQFGSIENSIPDNFNITSVYPNPFNPTTTIEFSIPSDNEVSIDIYNIKGELVSSLGGNNYNAGYHSIKWDANTHSSGIYFVMIESSNMMVTQKLVLIK